MTAPRQLLLFTPIEKDEPTSPDEPARLTEAGKRAHRPSGLAAPTDDPGTLQRDSMLELRSRLAPLLGGRLGDLTLTNNRSRILSAAPDGKSLDVRIHHSFCLARDEVLQAVAAFVTSDRDSATRRQHLAKIRQHFAGHSKEEAPRRRPVLRPIGRAHDLRELYAALNREYFADSVEAAITWGRNPTSRRRRRGGFSIRLGSYQATDRLIRVHPALDRRDVPRYVVESVVYHEMLHAAMPATLSRGRRRLHPPEFRRRERLYHHFTAAEAWLEKNLERLVRGRPLTR